MSNRLCVFSIAAALAFVCFFSLPAHADTILLGSDYLTTIPPTSFTGLGNLQGLAIGPGSTDTIVHRRADCSITLSILGSTCTIPLEMVALSLQSTTNPLLLVRESPTIQSQGTMTLTSNGSGTGGTFTSFFDVFFELSPDGGINWSPQPDLTLTGGSTPWSTIPGNILLVPGLVGNQADNLHTNKVAGQADFYIVGSVTEQHPEVGVHTAIPTPVPEPSTWVLLAIGFGLLGLARRMKA
jgi:hypothetical protein